MSRRRWFPAVTALMVVPAACAGVGDGGEDSATTEQVATTQAGQTGATDTSGGPSTVTSEVGFTVAELGRVPDRALGTTAAAASGCAPGTDVLPDGVWFGWVAEAGPDQVAFDLACYWPGRLQPAVSNDAARAQQVGVSIQLGLDRVVTSAQGEPRLDDLQQPGPAGWDVRPWLRCDRLIMMATIVEVWSPK